MRSTVALIVAMTCVLQANIASADSWQFTAVPEAAGIWGISPSGDAMVGQSKTAQGLLWNAGTISTFGVPGAKYTDLRGISDSGEIAGYWCSPSQPYYSAFTTSVSTFGTRSSINVAGADNTIAVGINNAGDIVGYYTGTTFWAGFLRHANGTYESITYPTGSLRSVATAINAAGVIVGYWLDGASNPHGWARDEAGGFTNFDVPGASGTYFGGVNDLGLMAGTWTDAAGNPHGFIRDTQGNVETVDFPLARPTYVMGISNTGTVVGEYQAVDGSWQGFYATPTSTTVPLPAAGTAGLSLLVFGGLLKAWRRRVAA